MLFNASITPYKYINTFDLLYHAYMQAFLTRLQSVDACLDPHMATDYASCVAHQVDSYRHGHGPSVPVEANMTEIVTSDAYPSQH